MKDHSATKLNQNLITFGFFKTELKKCFGKLIIQKQLTMSIRSKGTICLMIILLSHQFIIAQTKSGAVIYKIAAPEKVTDYKDTTDIESAKEKEQIVEQHQSLKESLNRVSYLLQFNKNEARFELTEESDSLCPEDKDKLLETIDFKGIYYSNINENLQLHQYENKGEIKLIESDFETLNWKIKNETKVIDQYITRKAQAKVSKPDSEEQFTVNAWYSPELTYYFGPAGFSDLPGLVLGLEYKGFYIYAEHLKIGDEKIAIVRPTEGASAKVQ